MAAVHLPTIPYEPNTASRQEESHTFCEIRPSTNNILYATFEDFITFLWVFKNIFRVFVRYELWVKVPIAIF